MSSAAEASPARAGRAVRAARRAMREGDEARALRLLASPGVDPDAATNREPLLYTAADCGMLRAVQFLLDRKANPNCCMVYSENHMYQEESPLFASARRVRTLLQSPVALLQVNTWAQQALCYGNTDTLQGVFDSGLRSPFV